MFGGGDFDAPRRADGFTHHAGDTAGRTVVAFGEPVAGSGSFGQGPGMLRILISDRGGNLFKKTKDVKDMQC